MKPAKEWGEEEVAGWVRERRPSLAPLFAEHNMDGEAMAYLSEELLSEMGIDAATIPELLDQIRDVFGIGLQTTPKRPAWVPSQEQHGGSSRNLVDIYTEGANVEENDSMYSYANRHGFVDNSEEGTAKVENQDWTRKLIEREKKWQKMMTRKKGDITLEYLLKQPDFKRRVVKGIPYSWRIQVWKLMASGELNEERIEIYNKLLERPTSEAEVNQIDLDINRTLRNHVNYKQRYGKGQKRLFNVLRAYANHNPEVGFCQGMATVCAFLMIHCDEETTFWMMNTLVLEDKFSLQGLWIAGFPKLMESFFVHDRLFKFHLPKLWKHFRALKIHPSSYATRWYMTVFLSFPFHTCLRIWDIFLLEGFDVMFFLAVATLEYFQAELQGKEFEKIMEFFGQLPRQELDDDKFIQMGVRVMRKTFSSMRGKHRALELIRDEYKKIVAEGGSPFADY